MTSAAKAKRIIDEFGEIEGYEYRGVTIARDPDACGVAKKYEIGGTFLSGGVGFDTLHDAKAHVDSKA